MDFFSGLVVTLILQIRNVFRSFKVNENWLGRIKNQYFGFPQKYSDNISKKISKTNALERKKKRFLNRNPIINLFRQ